MPVPQIKDLHPSNELIYDTYINETCNQCVNYNKKHLKLTVEFALYIYQQMDYGIKTFGKGPSDLSRDIASRMASEGHYINPGTVLRHYQTIRFLEEIKFEDTVLHNRFLVALNKGNIKFTNVETISGRAGDLGAKMEIMKKMMKDPMSRADLNILIGSKNNSTVAISNLFESQYIVESYRAKYLTDNMKIFCPYDTGEEMHGQFEVANKEVRKQFHLHGKLTGPDFEPLPDDSYDGAFLMLPQYNHIRYSDDFWIKNPDDFLERFINLVEESIRITRLDGIIGVVTWNKPLFGPNTHDIHGMVYKTLDASCEWIDTVINPLSMALKKKFPSAAYRSILIFKKR